MKLVKDVEAGKESNGRSYAILEIAVGEPMENHVTKLEIVVKGMLAENCIKYLKKGSNVMAEGRITSDRMNINGQSIDMVKVLASSVVFVSKK